jgi:hypothetical protein
MGPLQWVIARRLTKCARLAAAVRIERAQAGDFPQARLNRSPCSLTGIVRIFSSRCRLPQGFKLRAHLVDRRLHVHTRLVLGGQFLIDHAELVTELAKCLDFLTVRERRADVVFTASQFSICRIVRWIARNCRSS